MRARLSVSVLSISLALMPLAAHAQQAPYASHAGETSSQAAARVSAVICQSAEQSSHLQPAAGDPTAYPHFVHYCTEFLDKASIGLPAARIDFMSQVCSQSIRQAIDRHTTHYYPEDGVNDWVECMQDQIRNAQRR